MGRAQGREAQAAAIKAQIAYRLTQALTHDVRVAPFDGRARALGQGRRIAAGEREHTAGVELRRPGGKRNHAARLQHAQHLRDGDLGARAEHVAELTQHHVVARVGERQRLDIGLDKLNGKPSQRGVGARHFKQGGSEIGTGHAGTTARGGQRHHTRAAANVQHTLPAMHAGKAHQVGGHRAGQHFKGREARPGDAGGLLHFGNWIHGRSLLVALCNRAASLIGMVAPGKVARIDWSVTVIAAAKNRRRATDVNSQARSTRRPYRHA